MKDKYPMEIPLENGLKLQIHRVHFNQYDFMIFDSNGNLEREFNY